jgi:hypothetical protein
MEPYVHYKLGQITPVLKFKQPGFKQVLCNMSIGYFLYTTSFSLMRNELVWSDTSPSARSAR